MGNGEGLTASPRRYQQGKDAGWSHLVTLGQEQEAQGGISHPHWEGRSKTIRIRRLRDSLHKNSKSIYEEATRTRKRVERGHRP